MQHWFFPHPDTHKKAHLISIQALAIYILFFVALQLGFNTFGLPAGGILGAVANVNEPDLIKLTNVQRQKHDLPPLLENPQLDAAALSKGKNMLTENYWAHYSPSGKDPWGFINGAGYKYQYAGENLARNFYNSADVVEAWMNSPTHKENILNAHYQEIGMAVLEGNLTGQKTILVVQEFGRPVTPVANIPPVQAQPKKVSEKIESPQEVVLPKAVAGESVDSFMVTKVLGMSVILMMLILTLIDIYIMRRRAVVRISTRHLPNIGLMVVTATTLSHLSAGAIL